MKQSPILWLPLRHRQHKFLNLNIHRPKAYTFSSLVEILKEISLIKIVEIINLCYMIRQNVNTMFPKKCIFQMYGFAWFWRLSMSRKSMATSLWCLAINPFCTCCRSKMVFHHHDLESTHTSYSIWVFPQSIKLTPKTTHVLTNDRMTWFYTIRICCINFRRSNEQFRNKDCDGWRDKQMHR